LGVSVDAPVGPALASQRTEPLVDIAFVEGGRGAVKEVQIRGANSRRGDLHDHVRGIHDGQIGNPVDANIVLAVPPNNSHR